MIRSIFAHDIAGTPFIWHAMKGYCVATAEDIKKTLFDNRATKSSFRERDYITLERLGFISSSEGDASLIASAKEKTNDSIFNGLYLILTTQCNLRCKYCFYRTQEGVRTSEKLSFDNAQKAIDAFASQMKIIDDERWFSQITFYGGEPLINEGCLRACVSYITELQNIGKLPKETVMVVNTNGTLISSEFASFAASKKLQVQISIDGPAQVNDSQRIYPSGVGSYASMIAGMDKLFRYNVDVLPLITVTEQNAPYIPALVVELCSKYKIKSYGMNLLMDLGKDLQVTDNYPQLAAEAMIKATKESRKFGVCDEGFVETVKSITNWKIAHHSCGGARKLTAFPDGSVHTCQALKQMDVGRLSDKTDGVIDPVILGSWRKRSRFDNKKCLSCAAIGVCGWGCAAAGYNRSGSIYSIDENYCKFLLHLFNMYFEPSKMTVARLL